MTAELLFCLKHRYDSDYCGKEHSHPCYEVVLYLSGGGTVTFGGKRYRFEPGTFMVCCPDQKHVERGRAGTEVLYIGVNFSDARGLREGVFSDAKYGIGEYLEKIYAETRSPSAVSDELCSLYCRIIGLKLARVGSVGEGRRRDLEFLAQYITAHCTEDLDITRLAEISGYSYDHFRKLFASRFGTTVNDYILHKRIERASEMLETSGFSIKEIAAECGFSSSARFCTKFKELTGRTPKQAQRAHALERATVDTDKFS